MSCCEKWAKETAHIKAMAGGGFAYPEIAHPSAQIEPDEDGTWNINGCCGGGCHVITEVRFCPFCGSRVEHDAVRKKGLTWDDVKNRSANSKP